MSTSVPFLPRPARAPTFALSYRRRGLLAGLTAAGVIARPTVGRAGRPALIGHLYSGNPDLETWGWEFLEPALHEQGLIPGRDVRIKARAGHSDPAAIDRAARELIAMKPDLLITRSNAGGVALSRLTRTIPIVVVSVNDPVGNGLAASLSRPGGNVTGVTAYAGGGLLAKRLQLLIECDPKPRRVAVLWVPRDSSPALRDEMVSAGRSLGISLEIVEANSADAFALAFERIAAMHPDALAISGTATITQHRQPICEFALKQRLPAIYGTRNFAQSGLLMTYGPNLFDSYRRGVAQVDKILRGAKPGELPIEQPTGYDLAINLRTARAIGVKVPVSLLQRADLVVD